MNEHGTYMVPLFSSILVISFRFYFLIWRLWHLPLNHGPKFFFGVAVAPGFYEGPGARWLTVYRRLLVLQHLILASAFVVPLALRRWDYLPLMAPIDVITFFTLVGGFALWVRLRLGRNPPQLSGTALALETRRLRDYISWPMETLLAVVMVASWLLICSQGVFQVDWGSPVLMTYVIVGIFPGKVILARMRFPLPVERTEEHHRWQEANCRYSLRVLDSLRWFFAVILAVYALQHGFPWVKTTTWLRWLGVGIAMGIWLVMVTFLIQGSGKIAKLGRDLLPVGSWSGPFQPARMMLRGGLTWGIAYCAGLAVLFVIFWH